MTPEQQAAFVMAQAACAMAEIAGMQAENANYNHPKYLKKDFDAVIARNVIGHNDVISYFTGRS